MPKSKRASKRVISTRRILSTRSPPNSAKNTFKRSTFERQARQTNIDGGDKSRVHRPAFLFTSRIAARTKPLEREHLLGTASVIMKDHGQALADSGQRQFDILRRSAASECEHRAHPSHDPRVGAGHVTQGI